MSNTNAWAVAFEDATKETASLIYGQLQVTIEYVVVKKGSPKRPWIEGSDSMADRSANVTLVINPLEETGLTKLIQRTILAKKWTEWGTIIIPSLRDGCGITESTPIDGKYVKVETVKSGNKYTDKTTGELKEGTTFKFLAVYDAREACLTAYMNDGNEVASNEPDDAGAIDMSPGAGNAVIDEKTEIETAKVLLPALVKMAAGNKAVLASTIASIPAVSKYFNVNSPEVVALLAA